MTAAVTCDPSVPRPATTPARPMTSSPSPAPVGSPPGCDGSRNRRAVWWRSVVAALALVTIDAATAGATLVLPVDLAEMAAAAPTIVHGRVSEVRSRMTEGRRTIESIVTVAVIDSLKGEPVTSLVFRIPNGQVGRYKRVMVGAPEFVAGEEVILFLDGRPPRVPVPFGLTQGVYRVTRGGDGRARVGPPPPVSSPQAERIVRGDPARRPLDLDTFIGRIREFAGEVRR